jgi:hypothetical protein
LFVFLEEVCEEDLEDLLPFKIVELPFIDFYEEESSYFDSSTYLDFESTDDLLSL